MSRVVALYLRLSPRPDGSYEGLDVQERAGREYAARVWPGVPVELFRDEGISAARDDTVRPGFERFRQWVREGRIAHVWSIEQSRLERKEADWFELAAELDAAGLGEVHTRREGVVEVRGVSAGITAVINANEIRKLKQRINDRLDDNAAQGMPPGSRPFGYRHATVDGVKTYEVVPDQAAIIREIADLVQRGWSLTNIARDLTARGITGAHGGALRSGTITSMVTNASVAGYRTHRGDIVGRGNWEPILDEPTWQAVRAKLSAPRVVQRVDGGVYPLSGRRRHGNGRKYALSGLMFCGVCKAPLVISVKQLTRGRKRSVPYALCHPNSGGRACVGVMYEPTEAYVLDELWVELDRPEFLEALTADDHEGRRDEITKALTALDVRRRDLAKMWSANRLTTDEWQAAKDGLDEQEAELRADLAAIPATVEPVDVEHARRAWPYMTLDEQREFLGMFVASVTIKRATPGARAFDPDRVEVAFRS
jgi:site-specific DNA recombinase